MTDAARVSLGFFAGSAATAVAVPLAVWLTWLWFDWRVGGADEDLVPFLAVVGCGVLTYFPALLFGGVVGARVLAGRAVWRV